MDQKDIRMYSTGEFAKLCNVNKKTLFYYDQVGILKPDIVLENGYRYYSLKQVEVFDVIDIMRKLKMSLKEIKLFLDNRTPENTIEVFNEKKKMIKEEIKSLEKMYNILEVKTDIIDSGLKANKDIFIEEQSEESLILSSKVRETDDIYDIHTCNDLINEVISSGLYCGYPVGVMISKERLELREFTEYDYFFTKVLGKREVDNLVKKPKGLYVCAYHYGYYETTYEVYDKIISYMKENNLEIDGYSYEETLIDEVAASSSEDFVIKVSVKCKEIK